VSVVPRALIADTINQIAFLEGRGTERRLTSIVEVSGLQSDGDYRLNDIATSQHLRAVGKELA
jgi:type IV secretion system protein VirB11